jgi:hypothetical protein
MPRKRSSTNATGGKGFTFADKVAGGFLVQMLARTFPIEHAYGQITALHFETKESGRSLDDLHLVLERGSETSRWSVSVKSNRQLTKNGFDPILVQDAWAEWTGADGANFNPALDLLGLVTGVVGEGTLEEWEDVRKEAASTTPERFLLRVSGARQLSATKKKIFESLCLPGRADKAHREEAVRLAAKLHVQHYNESKAEGRFVNQCAQLTTSGALEEGTKLWNSLLQLASDNRGTGGYFDLPKLLRHLRAGFDLRDYPDFEVDWTRLDGLTSSNLAGVRAVLV